MEQTWPSKAEAYSLETPVGLGAFGLVSSLLNESGVASESVGRRKHGQDSRNQDY